MQEILEPQWSVLDVIDACSVHSKAVAKKFAGDREALASLEKAYGKAARDGFGKEFMSSLCEVNVTSKKDRLDLYSNRMVGPNSSGYKYYRSAVRSGRGLCAFCFARAAVEADHYIPKEIWSELCFMPVNLLPICSKCNRAKGEWFSFDRSKQFLHSYFEAIDDVEWVHAYVVDGRPVPEFQIASRCDDGLLGERIEWQAERLSLPSVYKEFAGRRLRELRIAIYYDYGEKPDPLRVKAYVGRLAQKSYGAYTRNYWEAQCLKAWWSSDWFLDEGCRLPEAQINELEKKMQKSCFVTEDGGRPQDDDSQPVVGGGVGG